MYKGLSVQVRPLDAGIVELCFDREGESINKLDSRTVREFREATQTIAASADVRGVLVTSAKDVFIVGADITEFGAMFQLAHDDLVANVANSNTALTAFEDLPIPSVVAINGFALGGGLEMAIAASLRVMSTAAQVGVPEVKLGLFPGFGGTVRLARIAGAPAAIQWVADGQPRSAQQALAEGVVDAVCEPQQLRDEALALLRRAITGEVDWRQQQARKLGPLPLDAAQREALFSQAKQRVQTASGKHQPAALMATTVIEQGAALDRAGALAIENDQFARVAKTQAAGSLVQAFLNEQALKKLFRGHAAKARKVSQGAVLGAGIMGGGIAVTCALRGIPMRMKDIAQGQLDLGMNEARKQVNKRVESGRMAKDKGETILASLQPQLDYAGFEQVGLVIEAVVENLGVKHKVLQELEQKVGSDTIIASNTSSLRIDDIAKPLARPENFVGMHFFNPVPVMALVEVIKGPKTSDAAVSTAVGFALAMGKTPIVVKDCPGFLVNRVLSAYVRPFMAMIIEGADFAQIDRAVEAFGWPMGPAYLQDVVGMDTGAHVGEVISAGYPDRMPPIANDPVSALVAKGRFGQKTGAGFYRYENDPKGRPRKLVDPAAYELLKSVQPNGVRPFEDQEIIDRMMIGCIVEAVHALEDGVVATPAELDMAMTLGVGFPAYLGGPLKYADWLGLDRVVALCDRYVHLGAQYRATDKMRQMAARGERFYPV